MSKFDDPPSRNLPGSGAESTYSRLIQFLSALRKQHIAYDLADHTGVVMVRAYVLGSVWEIEFPESDMVGIERFVSSGFVGRPFTEKGIDALDFFVTLHGTVSGEPEEDTERFKALYPTLYGKLIDVLSESDPVGLGSEPEVSKDQLLKRYVPAVEFILTYLWADKTVDDVMQTVWRALAQNYGWDRAGAPERYRELTVRIWDEWTRAGGGDDNDDNSA
jgi:hypothetical protein